MTQKERIELVKRAGCYLGWMIDRSGCFKGENLLGTPLHSGIVRDAWIKIHMDNGECIKLYNNPKESLAKHEYCGDVITNVRDLDYTIYFEVDYFDIKVVSPEVNIDYHIPLSSISWIDYIESTKNFENEYQ